MDMDATHTAKPYTIKELIKLLLDQPPDVPVYIEEIGDDGYARVVPLSTVISSWRTSDGRVVLGSEREA